MRLAIACVLTSITVVACGDRSQTNFGETDSTESETGGMAEPDLRVFAFLNQTCVISSGTRLNCWGRNLYGRLGMGVEGTIGDDEHPSALPGLEFPVEIADVSFGGMHGCVRDVSGTVHCWGSKFDGILGFAWDDEVVG